MERRVLEERLKEATRAALDLARQLVSDPLPDVVRYRILHTSGTFEDAAKLQEIDAAKVIETLWQDGRIPEWVNIHADAIGHGFTRIDLHACPRFVEQATPFQIRGPAMAGRTRDGDELYSIFEVSTCWTAEQLRQVCAAAGPVLWLDLCGDAFEDDALIAVGKLTTLERLRFTKTKMTGAGLTHLEDLEALEFLGADGCETLAALPKLTIDHLELNALPTDVKGLTRLNDATRFLSTLTLGFADACNSNAALELPFLSQLELRCASVEKLPRVSAPSLKRLALHATQCDERAIIDCALAFPALEKFDLGATPVPPRVIEALGSSLPNLSLLQS